MSDIAAVVLDAFNVAISTAAGKIVHHFHPRIVDQHEIGHYVHLNVAISGEHTEHSTQWHGRVVRSDFMFLHRLTKFQEKLSAILQDQKLEVQAMSLVYLEETRQFGISVVVEKT